MVNLHLKLIYKTQMFSLTLWLQYLIIERHLVLKISQSKSYNCVFILTYLGLRVVEIEIQAENSKPRKNRQIKVINFTHYDTKK